MIDALLRLFSLRPFLTVAIFGIPVLILILVGLFTIWALKILVFVVLPIALLIWIVRSFFGPSSTDS